MAKALRHGGTVFVAVAVLLVIAAAAVLLWPGTVTSRGMECSTEAVEPGQPSVPEVCREISSTVWDEGGEAAVIIGWSLILLGVASIPLVRRTWLTRLLCGLALAAFAVLGSWTIGLFFAPAAIVLLFSSALPPYRRGGAARARSVRWPGGVLPPGGERSAGNRFDIDNDRPRFRSHARPGPRPPFCG